MLSQTPLRARPDPPSPSRPSPSPSPSPPPPNRHIHGRLQDSRNPAAAPILTNKAIVVAPPAGAAPLPPPPSRSSPFNFARPNFGPPISFKPFFAAQRSNGSTIGSHLRRGHSIAASIPTASESASSSGDGDREDDSDASSDVEHIQVPRRPVPGMFRLPAPMRDSRAHPQGPWPHPGSSFSHSLLSAPRFTPFHRPPNRRSRSASSGTTPTRGASRRIWADVADQRSKVHRLRETLRKKRFDLQARRHQTDRADNEFMQVVRPLLVSALSTVALPAKTIGERLQLLQGARDAYYSAENAYGDREAQLDHEERRLHTLELALQQILDNQRGDDNDDSSYGTSDDEKEESSVASHQNDAGNINNTNTSRQTPRGSDANLVTSTEKRDTVRSDTDRAHDNSGKHETPGGETGHVSNNTGKDDVAKPGLNCNYILLGIDGNRAEDIHPLYHNLLSAAVDRELATEHHVELHLRHNGILKRLEKVLHLERARTSRGNQLSDHDLLSLKSSLAEFPTSVEESERKFGIPIDQDDLEFLQGYKTEEEAVRKEMERAGQEVVRLKALCEDKAAMRKNPPYEEEFTLLKGTNMASRLPEGNMALNHQAAPSLSHPIFPILLSNPMHVLGLKTPMAALKEAMQMPKDDPGVALRRINCMKELGISRLMQKPENKTDFINQWLIHRLRTSPMEVELLFSISTGYFRIMDLRRWQQDVLAHWKTDDATGRLRLSLERSWTTRDEVVVDDGTSESDGSEVHGDADSL